MEDSGAGRTSLRAAWIRAGPGRAPLPHRSPLPHQLLGGVPRPSGQLGLGLSGRLWGRRGGKECFPGGTGFRLSAEDGSPRRPCTCGCCSAGHDPCAVDQLMQGERPRNLGRSPLGFTTGSKLAPCPYSQRKARCTPPCLPATAPISRDEQVLQTPTPRFIRHARTISQTQTHLPMRLILVFFPGLICLTFVPLTLPTVSTYSGRTRSLTILSPSIPGTGPQHGAGTQLALHGCLVSY